MFRACQNSRWRNYFILFTAVLINNIIFSHAVEIDGKPDEKIVICRGNNDCHVLYDSSVFTETELGDKELISVEYKSNSSDLSTRSRHGRHALITQEKSKSHLTTQPRSFVVLYNNRQSTTIFRDSSIDVLVDFIIDMVRNEIIKKKMDQIKIPDIHEKFHKRIGPLKVKGTFDGSQGWFKSLSSLYRTEGIIVSRRGNILSVTAGFGLKVMVFGYDRYKAKFEHIGPRGHIKGEVDHNAFEVKLAIDLQGSHCKITLTGLRVKSFSKLKIHLSGLGKLSWIFSKVVTWVTNMFKDKIIHLVEKGLADSLQSVLSRIQCYENFKKPFYY